MGHCISGQVPLGQWRARGGYGAPGGRPYAGWRVASLGSVFRRALEDRGEAGQRHTGPCPIWHTHTTTAAANEFWAAQGQTIRREVGEGRKNVVIAHVIDPWKDLLSYDFVLTPPRPDPSAVAVVSVRVLTCEEEERQS
ncbi:hypothetical protein E2C01_018505 [Portunus trituberculatus]|uniref:Uncharacterized protein n=1 Tax=Portunus trituberculatus TaxID=210409 RepID=A0A5B7DVT5_PORTR|nr:hypothetical protein [Portunus trituberculatus]